MKIRRTPACQVEDRNATSEHRCVEDHTCVGATEILFDPMRSAEASDLFLGITQNSDVDRELPFDGQCTSRLE